MVTTMTQEECDEADARALACHLLHGTDPTECASRYFVFLREEKRLLTYAEREPWWQRYGTVLRQLPKEQP